MLPIEIQIKIVTLVLGFNPYKPFSSPLPISTAHSLRMAFAELGIRLMPLHIRASSKVEAFVAARSRDQPVPLSGWLQTGYEGATGNTVEWDPWTEKWRVRVPPFAQFMKGLVNALPDSYFDDE